jgi:hypothetical protein
MFSPRVCPSIYAGFFGLLHPQKGRSVNVKEPPHILGQSFCRDRCIVARPCCADQPTKSQDHFLSAAHPLLGSGVGGGRNGNPWYMIVILVFLHTYAAPLVGVIAPEQRHGVLRVLVLKQPL